MKIFHRVEFKKHDPLDDGLSDEIAREKREGGIDLLEEAGQDIVNFWEEVHKNLKKDSQK